ncbi:MAG: hypothetical protein RL071_3768 [Pseudomonadota bacterium]|jgi:hypothetical protein
MSCTARPPLRGRAALLPLLRPSRLLPLSVALWLAPALGGLGCGGDEVAAPVEVAPALTALPAALVASAWPVRLAADAPRAPFEAHPGWGLLFSRKLDEALPAFAAAPAVPVGLARVHLDIAAVYRNAALLGANATRHVYGTDRLPQDPPQVDYLLADALAVTGDCAGVKAKLEGLGSQLAPQPALAERAAALGAWAASPGCPADLSVFSAAPFAALTEAPTPGQSPTVPVAAPYRFALPDGASDLEGAELGLLVELARWHEAAARAAVPEAGAVIDLHIAPALLPAEARAAVGEAPTLSDEWLFGSFHMSGADVAFAAAARGDGLAAVEAWKDRSLYAAALAPAVQGGKLVPELVLDQAAAMSRSLRDGMGASAGGPQDFHRLFADLAVVGLLRAGALVADAAGEARDAGILRVNAFERSAGPSSDPVFLLGLAAWDAGNRSPVRAQEIIHLQLPRFPALGAARYPLDALHLRLGRTAAPSAPVH